MEFFSIYSIPPLISAVMFLFIGIIVYKNNTKSHLNNTFFALCVTTFIWQFAMFLLFNTKDPAIAAILVKVAHIGIIFLPVFIYHFVINLTGLGKKTDIWFLRINYALAFLFEFLLFTDFFINGFYTYFWSFYPKAGMFHPLYLLFLSLTFLRIQFLFLSIFYGKNKLRGIGVHQMKYVFWAIIFYTFAASDFLLNYGIEFYPIGFLFILTFMSITAYAIIKHRFMDIKIVLRQSSVHILSFSVLSALAVFLSYFNNPTGKYFHLLNACAIVLLVILYPFVKKYFMRLANKYFFTSLYDNKKVISELSHRLRTTLELDYVYEYIFDTIDSAFHTEAFGFLTFNPENNSYEFKYKKGFFNNLPGSFKGDLKLHQHYTKKNKVIVSNELKNTDDHTFIEMSKKFNQLGIEILIPVSVKWKNIGLLVLGDKETKDMYTVGDIDLLETIASIGATAIENGFLYKNISEKNKKLEYLLEVKNDFLRIANHQLNTPLSIMRLAFSSVEEKSIPIKEGFLMAKEGLNRITNVIFQLWSVFDLEGGELNLKKDEIDLFKMFQEVIKEKNTTKQVIEKKLKINLNQPNEIKNFTVIADQQKIKNVISALIDNAIFYTKKGSITIDFDKQSSKNGDFLKTIITDTGVGISKEDQKNIFEKFFRGKSAVLLHPDGSGLGLYVAKNLIEASGGKFLLEKTSNETGSVFSFTLPTTIIEK